MNEDALEKGGKVNIETKWGMNEIVCSKVILRVCFVRLNFLLNYVFD